MFPGIVPFVIPSLPYVERVADALAATSVRVGVQNVRWAEEGAFTGEVSARMAAEVGATIAEIGPSERRAMFGETDETVRARTKAALAAGLTPVVCIGAAGRRMMRARPPRRSSGRQRWLCPGSRPTKRGRCILAYEPVWSIGDDAALRRQRQPRQCSGAFRHAACRRPLRRPRRLNSREFPRARRRGGGGAQRGWHLITGR
jgi:triosephosphate isomerase